MQTKPLITKQAEQWQHLKIKNALYRHENVKVHVTIRN
jgi:hypothetical protein